MPFTTTTSSTVDFIQWEDLPPIPDAPAHADSSLLEDEEPMAPPKMKRFYVPPPMSDIQLSRLDATKVADWPKSRVVWALGRIGFVNDLSSATGPFSALLGRTRDVIDSLSTRDMVRMLQAIAYGPRIEDSSIVFAIRRKFSVDIDKVNELFLLSFIYGNAKLTSRMDWTPTPNCVKSMQFLISELIHRKGKIDAGRFLDISAALASSDRVFKQHAESVNTLLTHAVDHSLQHVKEAKRLEAFGKCLCNEKSQTFFSQVNERMDKKFKNKSWRSCTDAARVGFYYFLADLMSIGTADSWLKAVMTSTQPVGRVESPPADAPVTDLHDWLREQRRVTEYHQMLRLVDIIVKQRNFAPLLSEDVITWLESIPSVPSGVMSDVVMFGSGTVKGLEEPLIGVESPHVSKVIRRMTEATIEGDFFTGQFVGPFYLPVANETGMVYVEWDTQWQLEVPHRRAIAKTIEGIRRTYLELCGWKLISLPRSEFKISSENDVDAVNSRFRVMTEACGVPVPWRVDPVVDRMRGRPPVPHNIPQLVSPDPKRERCESRSRQHRLKSQLKSIRKQFRSKASRI